MTIHLNGYLIQSHHNLELSYFTWLLRWKHSTFMVNYTYKYYTHPYNIYAFYFILSTSA
jgi:hypothetical protein